MKLTAIALPILIAFSASQPAQARDYSQTSDGYFYITYNGSQAYRHDNRDVKKHVTKPEKKRIVTRNKTIEKKVIRNANGKKTVINKTIVKKKVVTKPAPHSPAVQKTYSQYELTRMAQRSGYNSIHDYSQRGKIAYMKARDRNGRLYDLEISTRTGKFLKQARVVIARPDHHTSYHRSTDRYNGGYSRHYERPSDDISYSFILRLNSFLNQGQAYWAY